MGVRLPFCQIDDGGDGDEDDDEDFIFGGFVDI